MRVLIILIGLLGLTACSQKSAKVKLELTSSFAFGGSDATKAVSEGGLMVWGKSAQGDHFARVLSDTDSVEIEIPNGQWIFSAVAWDSANSTPMDTDAVRCARSASTDLKGDSAAVSLVLTGPNCNSVNFRGNSSSISTAFNLRLCQDTADVIGTSDSCSDDMIDFSRKSSKAPVLSVRVRLDEFDKFGSSVVSQGAGLSRCVSMPVSRNGEWDVPPDLAIPVGDPANPASAPFRTTFELYPASFDCGATMDAASTAIILPSGLASGVGGHKYFGSIGQYLYLNVPDATICSGLTGLSPFAGGTGAREYPFLICSVEQLYNILDNTDLTHSYRLMTDINLNPFSKGLSGSTPTVWPAAAASCWEEGQNWMPIGRDSSCVQIPAGFAGSFYGGGHTITGMRMRMNNPEAGFISKWYPVTNDQSITNLTFVDPEVEGDSLVGTVVGNKPAVSAVYALIANVEVRGGEVTAGQTTNISNVGGIVGFSHRTQLRNLKTSRVKIEGEGDHIGGIFGHSSGSQTLFQLVSRSYVGGPSWSQARYVGGIGGKVGSDNLLAGQFGEWASESIVVGSQYVGGLLGEWLSTYNTVAVTHRPLENVYAAGSITMRGQNANDLGGLVGTNYAGAVLNKAYFAGSLLNDAEIANCGGTCNVGWLSGYARTMTRSNDYVMYETAAGHYSLLPRTGYGDDPDAGGAGVIWGPINISTASVFTPPTMSPMMTSPWVHLLGDKPRLLFEKHPCSADADSNGISPRTLLASQKNFWGSATKPMMICRQAQFNEITGHLAAGKIAVIVGALNLGSASAHVKPTVVAGAYLTGEAGYIHGLRRVESLSSFQWAPFNLISGTLTKLLIAGIQLDGMAGTTSPSTISGVAQANNGLIEDVKLLTGKLEKNDPDIKLSGLVSNNAGTMRDVSFEGTLLGDGNLAGLVALNTGTIEDSETSGRLILYNGGSSIGGVAIENTSTIQRVKMSSKLRSLTAVPATATQLGMVVHKNSGTIKDVHVTSEADWRANFASAQSLGTNEVGQIVGKVQTGSIIKRVIVEGFLHDIIDTLALTAGNSNFVGNALGSMSSIFAVPAGRLITEAQPSQITSCSGTTLTMHSSFVLPSAFNGTGYFTSNLLSVNKVVWAVFDNGDGNFSYTYVTDWVEGTNDSLSLSSNCTGLGGLGFTASTRIRFVQDFDDDLDGAGANGQLTTSPFVGFTPDSDRFSAANLTDVGNSNDTGWREDIPNAPVPNTVLARDTAGMDWILDIMGEFINNGSATTPKPIWEVEGDERIELFRIKK